LRQTSLQVEKPLSVLFSVPFCHLIQPLFAPGHRERGQSGCGTKDVRSLERLWDRGFCFECAIVGPPSPLSVHWSPYFSPFGPMGLRRAVDKTPSL
jgi:hypothetical protein